MADQDSKTEEPTQRKLEKAREEGQFARSQDLTVAMITLGAALAIYAIGIYFPRNILELMTSLFLLDQNLIENPNSMQASFLTAFVDLLLLFLPVVIVTIVMALGANFLFGGIGFSIKGFLPKGQKINPLSGLKKIFSAKSLFELVKSLLKLAVISGFLYFCYVLFWEKLLSIGTFSTQLAIISGLSIVAQAFVVLSVALLIIAAVDAPYQFFQFKDQQKMSFQEIKDEYKESEGQPEVKRKIREKQREAAMASMIDAIKDADVVVTNPNHFAVALSYQVGGTAAPVVIAKGMNLIAERIKEEAKNLGVTIFEQPELARALYFTTEINSQIPEQLYKVVAEVIAYVFNLNAFVADQRQVQKPLIRVPDDCRYDEFGRAINKPD
ncbi:MAG: flagellar biosynthesis protein FlhB [Rhodospirillales bacterium]